MKRNHSLFALSLAVAAGVAGAASLASAFPFLYSWHQASDGQRAGGGGIYGTGGAQDFNLSCAHCHVQGAGTIDATVTPSPAWQLLAGQPAYVPGQKYTITVKLVGEHKGLGQGTNNLNGMAMTFEDSAGRAIGFLASDVAGNDQGTCPATAPATNPAAPATTYLYGPSKNCKTVVYNPLPNLTSWTFSWTAPAAGSGAVTGFYGVVDGDADGKSSLDDDVKMGTVKLAEGK